MSWFTDLAGKAEDFLIKIDQNAAQALNKDAATPSHSRRSSAVASLSDFHTVKQPFVENESKALQPPQRARSPVKREKKPLKGKDQDAELLAMLNTPEEPPSPGVIAPSHTRAASLGAFAFTENATPLLNGNLPKMTKTNSAHSGLSLAEENELLRKEINTLSQEARQALQRAKAAESETSRLISQSKNQSSQISKLEEQLSGLRRENVRLGDELLFKDSQISALETKVAAVQIDLNRREDEDTDAEKLQTLNAELSESAKRLEDEKLHFQASLSQAQSRILQLEQSNGMLSAELKSAQQRVEENSRLLAQNSTSLAAVREELSSTQTAFNEYKVRAQRILTDKEKLISEIKEGAGFQSHVLSEAEVEHLRQERDLLREEAAQTASHLNSLRQDMFAMEQRYETEIRGLREAHSAVKTQLQDEKRQRLVVEEEARSAQEELRFLRQDSAQQRVQASTRLRETETEILRLRSQLATKRHSSATEQELERRLQTTTETLLSKQAALEAVQAERSSLMLQLERKNRELRELDSAQHRVTLNITDDAKASTGVASNADENGIKRRVRRAYGTIDALNIRLGTALRRYPVARVGVLLYMVLLHLWVGIVLVTYTPEIHGPNHDKRR